MDIRLPNINAPTESGQLAQIRSYLYQFSEQLNWALNDIENKEGGTNNPSAVNQASGGTSSSDTQTSFEDLKALIIKSADIIDSYYEEINKRLEGVYVAQSDFGTYYEQSSVDLKATSDGLVQKYEHIQKTLDELGEKVGDIETDANIKSGLLKYAEIGEQDGIPIYGIQVGQTTEVDGEEVFNKLSQFSTLGLELYDSVNETKPRTYLHINELNVPNAKIPGTLTLGGYDLDTTDGIAFKWVGGAG